MCSTPAVKLTFLPGFVTEDLLPLQCSASLGTDMKNLLKYSEAVPLWSNEHNNRLVCRLPASAAASVSYTPTAAGLQTGVFLFINIRTSEITVGFSALGSKGTCATYIFPR